MFLSSFCIVCHLCKGQASLIVHLEDLLDGIDVSCRPQIQAQVVLVCRAHNLLQRKILLHEYRFDYVNAHLQSIKSINKH